MKCGWPGGGPYIDARAEGLTQNTRAAYIPRATLSRPGDPSLTLSGGTLGDAASHVRF